MGAVIETSKTTSLFCPTTSRFGIRKWEPLFGALFGHPARSKGTSHFRQNGSSHFGHLPILDADLTAIAGQIIYYIYLTMLGYGRMFSLLNSCGVCSDVRRN